MLGVEAVRGAARSRCWKGDFAWCYQVHEDVMCRSWRERGGQVPQEDLLMENSHQDTFALW